MRYQTIIGVNIGQGNNHTTIAEVNFMGWSYAIIQFTRLPLGTTYSEIGQPLSQSLQASMLQGFNGDPNIEIRVNATGIGSPIITYLRMEVEKQLNLGNLDLMNVYLTGGYKAEETKDGLMLPKELMISHLKVSFQSNRISGYFIKPERQMSATDREQLALFNGLKNEIINYETKVHVDPAHWDPDIKTGEHDDLAIALGLACWTLPKETQT